MDILDFIKKILRFSKSYKLYYFEGKNIKNAGDIYNADLVNYFGIKYTKSKKIKKASLICVGSLLDKLSEKSNKKLIIAGCGFILPPNENDCINRDVQVLALRGKFSLKRMQDLLNEPLRDCVLGDPGLLISKIYPQKLTKKYKVGIIPHYYDKQLWDSTKIKLNSSKYKFIDILQSAETLVKEICECECILSSSLHGLIFADSYNIPNRQLVMSEKLAGGNYKFADYYSAFDLSLPEVIDLRTSVIDETLIENVMQTYVQKDILLKQQNLINVFNKLVALQD